MNNKFKDMERNIDSISISVIKSLEKEWVNHFFRGIDVTTL